MNILINEFALFKKDVRETEKSKTAATPNVRKKNDVKNKVEQEKGKEDSVEIIKSTNKHHPEKQKDPPTIKDKPTSYAKATSRGHHRRNSIVECWSCKSKFKSEHSLNMHIDQIHVNDQRNSCYDCKMTFHSKSSLKMHYNRDHSSYAHQSNPQYLQGHYYSQGDWKDVQRGRGHRQYGEPQDSNTNLQRGTYYNNQNRRPYDWYGASTSNRFSVLDAPKNGRWGPVV